METLFLHGFNSAPVNHDPNWLTLKLNYGNVYESLSELEDFIEENGISYIVAKSLGAYFALTLYNRNTNLKLFLINPALEPCQLLEEYNDTTIVNYRDGTSNYIPVDFTKKLKEINPAINSHFYYTGEAFLEFGDVRIDQRRNYGLIHCEVKNAYEGGDHRFTRMDEAIEIINNSINYDF